MSGQERSATWSDLASRDENRTFPLADIGVRCVTAKGPLDPHVKPAIASESELQNIHRKVNHASLGANQFKPAL